MLSFEKLLAAWLVLIRSKYSVLPLGDGLKYLTLVPGCAWYEDCTR